MSEWISTKEAMRMLGVGSTTIKRWADERRLPYIRTAGGHRRFQRSAVLNLIAQNGRAEGNAASVSAWVADLQTRDVVAIRREIERTYDELGDWYAVADFLGQVATEIGRCWAGGKISVVDEHIASARLSQALVAIGGSIVVDDDAPVCLLATPVGEQHTLGLNLTQVCMRSSNIDVLWVGIEVPTAELGKHLRERHTEQQLVALSASQWMTDAGTLEVVYREISAACRESQTQLILGGSGAWPEALGFGYRCHSFSGLKRILEDIYPANFSHQGLPGSAD